MTAAREGDATGEKGAAIVALVDELAALAADLWAAGKLEQFPPAEQEPADADED